MSFASLADFLAMGRHGLYVWSALAITLAVLGLNLLLPWQAWRRYRQDEARRQRREEPRP